MFEIRKEAKRRIWRPRSVLSILLTSVMLTEGILLPVKRAYSEENGIENSETETRLNSKSKIFIKGQHNSDMGDRKMAEKQITIEEQRSIALSKVESTANKYIQTKTQSAYTSYTKALKAAEEIIKPGDKSNFEKLNRAKERVQATLDIKWVLNDKNSDPSQSYQKMLAEKKINEDYADGMAEAWNRLTEQEKEKFNKVVKLEPPKKEAGSEKVAVEKTVKKPKKGEPKTARTADEQKQMEEEEKNRQSELLQKTIRDIMSKPGMFFHQGVDAVLITISGTGTMASTGSNSSYDAFFRFQKHDGQQLAEEWLVGLRGLSQSEGSQQYGLSYETIGHNTFERKGKEFKSSEFELILKDFMADLTNSGGVPRLASIRKYIHKNEVDYGGYLSAETGAGSAIYVKREPDGNMLSGQLIGSQSLFSASGQRIGNKPFVEYDPGIAAFRALGGPYQSISSFANFATDMSAFMPPPPGDVFIDLKGKDEKGKQYSMTEKYTNSGGTIAIGKDEEGREIRMAISQPIIEKNKPEDAPEIFVFASYVRRYKDKSGKTKDEYIGKEQIPINTDYSPQEDNVPGLPEEVQNLHLSIRPTQDALVPITQQLNNYSYTLKINDGMPLSITPSTNPTYLYHDAKNNADYKVTLSNITLEDPIINSKPRLYAQVQVDKINNLTQTVLDTRTQKAEMGIDTLFAVGGNTIKITAEVPPYIVMMNPEKVTENISVRNDAVKSRGSNVNDRIIQTVDLKKSNMSVPLLGNKTVGEIKGMFLSDVIPGLKNTEQEQYQKSLGGTRKSEEVGTERLEDVSLAGNVLNLDYKKPVGMNANLYNAQGNGIWATVYDSEKLSDVLSTGQSLEELTARTGHLGWDSFGITGGTILGTRTYSFTPQGSTSATGTSVQELSSKAGGELWYYLKARVLEGEARTGGYSTSELRTVGSPGANVIANGNDYTTSFRAFDPNRKGFQMLAFDWHAQNEKGSDKPGNTVVVERGRYFCDFGYNYEGAKGDAFSRLWGKASFENTSELFDNEMKLFTAAGPTSLSDASKTIMDRWNPRVGFSGKVGTYEFTYTGMTQEQRRATQEVGGIINLTDQLRQDLIGLTVGGIPLLAGEKRKLTVDGRSNLEFTTRDQLTLDTVAGTSQLVSNSRNVLVEVQPTLTTTHELEDKNRTKVESAWYLLIGTQLQSTDAANTLKGTLQNTTTTTQKRIYAKPGYKWGRVLELRGNFEIDTTNTETVNPIMNQLSELHNQQLTMGGVFNTVLGKDMTFSANAQYVQQTGTAGKSGSWYGKLSFTVPFGGPKESAKPNESAKEKK